MPIGNSGAGSGSAGFRGAATIDGTVRVDKHELCGILVVVVFAAVLDVAVDTGVDTLFADDVRFNFAQLNRRLQLVFFDLPSLLQLLQNLGCVFFFF